MQELSDGTGVAKEEIKEEKMEKWNSRRRPRCTEHPLHNARTLALPCISKSI